MYSPALLVHAGIVSGWKRNKNTNAMRPGPEQYLIHLRKGSTHTHTNGRGLRLTFALRCSVVPF